MPQRDEIMDNDNGLLGQNARGNVRRRAWVFLCLAGVVVLLVPIVGPALVPPLPFDAQSWKSGAISIRGRMSLHPEFAPSLIGLSETELVERLGEPTVRWPYTKDPDEMQFTYKIRLPFAILYRHLVIRLTSGKVSSVYIMKD